MTLVDTLVGVERLSGEGEERVVQRRAAQRQLVDLDSAGPDCGGDGVELVGLTRRGDGQQPAFRRRGDREPFTQDLLETVESGLVDRGDIDSLATDTGFEFGRGSAGWWVAKKGG